VHRPKLLLCDEPFGALDEPGAAALGALLAALRAEGGAVLLITHDIAQGLRHASHAATMRDGKLLGVEPVAGLDAIRFAARYRELSGAADAA
jgi:ABC-type sulfate/molybdate transport systems ATPase subunit